MGRQALKPPSRDLLIALNTFFSVGRNGRDALVQSGFYREEEGCLREFIRRRERRLLQDLVRMEAAMRKDAHFVRTLLLFSRSCRGKQERIVEIFLQLWCFAVWNAFRQ